MTRAAWEENMSHESPRPAALNSLLLPVMLGHEDDAHPTRPRCRIGKGQDMKPAR